MVVPLTLLYAAMTAQTPAATIRSNGVRYSSRNTRSSTSAFTLKRSFGVVGDEVLDRGSNPFGLQARDVRRSDHGRKLRILTEALEMPTAIRSAVQVDGRRKQNVHAFASSLTGEQPPHALHSDRIPARRQGSR